MKLTHDELIALAKDKSISWVTDFGQLKGGCKFTWSGYLELARVIESFTEQRLSEPREGVKCNAQEAETIDLQLLAGLLRKVIAYYEGQGKYNFSRLSNYDRDNAAFNAWQEIRQEIKEALRDYSAQKRKTMDKQDFNSGLAEKVFSAYEDAPLIEEPFMACRLGVSAALEALAVNADWEAEDPKSLTLRIAEQIRKNGENQQ